MCRASWGCGTWSGLCGFKSSGTYAPHHCPAQSKRRADNNQLKGRPLNCCHNEVISLGELVVRLVADLAARVHAHTHYFSSWVVGPPLGRSLVSMTTHHWSCRDAAPPPRTLSMTSSDTSNTSCSIPCSHSC